MKTTTIPKAAPKKAAAQATLKDTAETPSTIRVVRADECRTLNGKSTLQLHVGIDARNDVHFRIAGNDGGGIFTPRWVSLKSVDSVFAHVGNLPQTARQMFPCFAHTSSNNVGFSCAVLLHLGLISRSPEEGKYLRADGKAFMSEMQKLIDTEFSLDVALPEKAGKKSAVSRPKKDAPTKSQKVVQAAPSISSSLVVPGNLEAA